MVQIWQMARVVQTGQMASVMQARQFYPLAKLETAKLKTTTLWTSLKTTTAESIKALLKATKVEPMTPRANLVIDMKFRYDFCGHVEADRKFLGWNRHRTGLDWQKRALEWTHGLKRVHGLKSSVRSKHTKWPLP